MDVSYHTKLDSRKVNPGSRSQKSTTGESQIYSRPLFDIGQSMKHGGLVLSISYFPWIYCISCELLFSWRNIRRGRRGWRFVANGRQLSSTE